jgi:hypothetical protein
MQTITEALAELATIDKRLPKKTDALLPYVARLEQVKDPFAAHGGTDKYLREEVQSFGDLLLRKIELRAAIAKANAETQVTIGGTTQSVADWLVWKRECYPLTRTLFQKLIAQVQRARTAAQEQKVGFAKEGEAQNPNDIIVCIDEQKLISDLDDLEEAYGRLDGLLSLRNATTQV